MKKEIIMYHSLAGGDGALQETVFPMAVPFASKFSFYVLIDFVSVSHEAVLIRSEVADMIWVLLAVLVHCLPPLRVRHCV